MHHINLIRRNNPELANKIEHDQHGFICGEDVEPLKAIDKSIMLLVRCGAGRFLSTVDNLNHFLEIIGEHSKLKAAAEGVQYAGDYVRDVALLDGDYVQGFARKV